MVLALKIGLLSIPVMTINFSNNRYSVSGLHQFSNCCNSPVGNKKYCKGCGKEFQFETENEGWIGYNPNSHEIRCPYCEFCVLVKTYPNIDWEGKKQK